jgi:putative ABC transport system substrate-binding protein
MNTEHTFEGQNEEETKAKEDQERKRKRQQKSVVYAAVAGVVIVLVVGGLLLRARTVEEPKIYKVGFYTEAPPQEACVTSFKESLAALGYVEGENITYVYRTAVIVDQDLLQRYSDLVGTPLFWKTVAQELVDEQVDLIVTGSEWTTQGALEASEDAGIPIVFTSVGDARGFVESYAHPGGRVTGITRGLIESTGKRMEILKRMVPDMQRVLLIYGVDATFAGIEPEQEAAETLGLELVEMPVDASGTQEVNINNYRAALQSVQPGEVDAFLPEEKVAATVPEEVVALAERNSLPYISPLFGLPDDLASYSADLYQSSVQAASLADKILRGEDPGSLPVESPKKLSLTINLGTAERVGLTIPEEVLSIADTVIPVGEGG